MRLGNEAENTAERHDNSVRRIHPIGLHIRAVARIAEQRDADKCQSRNGPYAVTEVTELRIADIDTGLYLTLFL